MSKIHSRLSRQQTIIACLLAFLALTAFRTAPRADQTQVVFSGGQTIMVGPYQVILNLSPDPPQVENPLVVTLLAQQHQSLSGQLIAQPGPGTDAIAVHAPLNGTPQQSNKLVASIHLSVRGAWHLIIELNGPQGHGTASLDVTVSAPDAIPTWLGWLIGLSPLLGFAWLIWHQLRYRRKLLLEKSPSY